MAYRPHPKGAEVNPSAPRAWGTCDRCGLVYNLHKLNYQYDWAGTQLINLRLRVCPTCMDDPSTAAKKAIVLPPDPLPVRDPRPENYAVDEGPTPVTSQSNYVTWDEPGITWDNGQSTWQ